MGEILFNEYKDSDIFVLPSLSEGTPRSLIEAMCNGVPVIATDAGGITFTVTDHENGLIVRAKDSKMLSEAIELLINDDTLREKLVRNGYNFAEMNTIESHANEVYQFIKSQCIDVSMI
jgi:glycosyltransferase involved in cell wall biosynthesis